MSAPRRRVPVMDRVTAWVARALIALLYVPIVGVIVYSFNGSDVTDKWTHFSLHWYSVLIHDAALLLSLRISVVVASLSATLATAIGLAAAMGLARSRFPGRSAFLAGLFAPLVVPEIVLGVVMLSLLSKLHIVLGVPTLVAGHLVIVTPYAAMILLAAYGTLDPSLQEAAADLSCSGWQTFRRVTFPLLKQAVLASWLLCFTISFGDIVMSTFTNGVGSTTLPLRVYSLLKSGLTPEINALGTLLVLFTLGIVAAVGARQMRQILVRSDNSA